VLRECGNAEPSDAGVYRISVIHAGASSTVDVRRIDGRAARTCVINGALLWTLLLQDSCQHHFRVAVRRNPNWDIALLGYRVDPTVRPGPPIDPDIAR
jgi:hypothetical protein